MSKIGKLRLLQLKEKNDLIREQMAQERPRFQAIANRHVNGTAPRAVTAFNLFQTPAAIAIELCIRAQIETHHRVLEPSAGLGRLWQAGKSRGLWTLVEIDAACCRELYSITDGHTAPIKQRDFLACSTDDIGGPFHRIVMNPPFKMGRDIKHIMHARSMLTPGGILVSLCYNGSKQNARLRPECDTWTVLPDGSFKESGTNASVVMLTMHC